MRTSANRLENAENRAQIGQKSCENVENLVIISINAHFTDLSIIVTR
jgi:hypothetical protein